ncbi:MAG: ABC transporter substrate-binding protein [Anaerolineae bacterium]
MKHRTWFLLLIVLAIVLTGCEGGALLGAREAREVTIAMGFIPNVQFTPVYVAIERGYFADEGLEVTLDYGTETDSLQRAGAGEVPFVIGSGDQVILARDKGLPVRYVANWYRRFPVCVVSLADSGISTPQDLVGKTVGTPQLAGASYIGWLAFLDEAGIAPEDVNLQVIGYTQVASLIEGRVDAVISYALNEPVQLGESGYDINVLYLDAYTHLVSNGLITNEDTIRDDPELVRGVTRAFLRGLQDTLDDPDAAFDIAAKAIPEMDEATATLQRAVLKECVAFWSSESLGVSNPEDWEESLALLEQLGLVTGDLDANALYTNEFVE